MVESKHIPYLDIYVEDLGSGHKVHFISLDNSVADTKLHMPWFTVYASRLPAQSCREIDGVPLLYDESKYVYMPNPLLKVYRCTADSRSLVPKTVSSILSNMPDARAGLYNIRYEVRVAFDFSQTHKLFGTPSPLIFLRNEEMVDWIEKVIDIVSNLKVMVVDIEVYSTSGGFPQKGDPILTISYAIFRLKDNIFTPDWPEKNVRVLSIPRTATKKTDMLKASRELVKRFFDILVQERPNLIVTYNGSGFDFPYMEPFKDDSVVLSPTTVVVSRDSEKILFPHIDLLMVRRYLGSSMGVRSHAAYALDDVALEVVEQIEDFYDMEWLKNSDYIKAERLLNHAVLKDYWERNDPIFHNYVVADVYLTALIARVWLYPLFILSALTGIPPSTLQYLNTGQIAEYVLVELLRRIGFYPELRTRTLEYGKSETSEADDEEDEEDIYSKGKVYVYDYGLFGGSGKKIIELDFAQMYPSDMVANTVDPTAVYVYETAKLIPHLGELKISRKTTEVLLGKKTKKSSSTIKPEIRLNIIHGYGPVSWLIYKLYTARRLTKKLKKRASEEKRLELASADTAIKILNNSFYGAFSKRRGNLVSEIISASVFWRTQRILYDVISFIENELSKELGRPLKVLYGDTDSTYILADAGVDPQIIVKKVNEYIQSKYGSFYQMEFEDTYDTMLIPKQKGENKPSGKSYICFKDGKPVKVKGEFFKLHAPIAIKEDLLDLYTLIVNAKPTSRKELRQIIKRFLESEPIYKWFIKKSISSFVNEDDPRKLKKLNKDFHYAALYTLVLNNSPGVTKLDTSKSILAFVNGGGFNVVRVRIDPRTVEKLQRTVIVNYLPHPVRNPKKFLVYVSDNGKEATIHLVNVQNVSIEKEGTSKGDVVEKYYVVTFAYKPITISKDVLLEKVIDAIDRYVIDTLAEKLVPAILKSVSTGELLAPA